MTRKSQNPWRIFSFWFSYEGTSPQKGPYLQNLADFFETPLSLKGQKPLSWPEMFCRCPFKGDTSHYVFTLRAIKVLLSRVDVQKCVFPVDSTKYELISEFKDVLIHKNNPLWASSNKTLTANLYSDESVCASPLGNKTKKCKFLPHTLRWATWQNKPKSKMLFAELSEKIVLCIKK